MCLLFFILLLLAGMVVGILRLHSRRLSPGARILFLAALLLIGLALLVVFGSMRSRDQEPLAVLLGFLVFLGLAIVLARWAWRRFLRAAFAAAPPQTCPPIGLLKGFLAERFPPAEQARLAAHLEACTACQHRVEGLTAGQEAWEGMARNLSQQPAAAPPALRRVMESLKEEQPQERTRAEPVSTGEGPLGFLSPADKPGQLGRLERYEVLEEIGRGGMGIVLKAFDPSLHRVVAIKVLAPQLATSGVARKRFLREARAAAAVTHDHIVTIHAVDEANGLPYLVMQYVAGRSLQERIDKDGPLGDLAEVVRIGVQTAAALAAAHGHGIVHRDVKPANILLEEGVPRVKITDFGLARAMDDASLTQSGFVAGSPLYMAPEQARGESLDHRADLFSLGSVLYTMCTGRPPFRAANTLAVLRRVCEDTPRPIRETNPEIPDWLAAIVAKLMAKGPAERFQSAAEVVEVLGRHLAELRQGGWVPPAPAPASPEPAGLPTSVTICPSCGASLHVPESVVGRTVHCGECGKPFRAEDGSEEILVARAVSSPFGGLAGAKRKLAAWGSIMSLVARAVPSPCGGLTGAKRKLVVWATILVACLGLLFFLLVLALDSSSPSHPRAATVMGTRPGQGAAPFWKDALKRFPAQATLFGAVDLRAFGSLTLGDEWTQTVLRLAGSAEANDKLTAENLGRVRIDRVSMAYYEDLKPETSRGLVQLEGVALDGRKRIIESIRQATAGKVQVEEDGEWWPTDNPVRISGPGLPFALGLFDDRRAFLARSANSAGEGNEHRKVLEHLPCFDFCPGPEPSSDLLDGYHPPWRQAALGEIPPDACGFLLGEIPSEWRSLLTRELALQTCPRTFVLHLRRQGDGVTLSLSLNLDKPSAERTLMEDLEQWRRHGLAVLQVRFPGTRKEPQALALLGQMLQTMRCEAKPGSGCVRTRVQISRLTGRALATLFRQASQLPEEGR